MFKNYCQKPTFSGAVVNIVNSSYLKACCWSSPHKTDHVALSKMFFPCKNNNQESFSGVATAITMQTFDGLGIFSVYLRGHLRAPIPMQNTLIFFPL